MDKLRFAMVGTGFWARFQLAGWLELPGVECVALCNRYRGKAEDLAGEFGVPAVYDDPQEMLECERLDFLDIVADASAHSALTHLAASHRLPVISQKPMATALAEAVQMVQVCRQAGVPFFVHENWRWQTPVRQLKSELLCGAIGAPFRARMHFCSSFPVFANQPFLKELEQFILTDIGSHILDTARFLFGEADTLYCRTHRIHTDIKGEDVATVMMTMGDGITVVCEMSYASRLEHERFPETYIYIEGEKGSIELGPDYWIRVTTQSGVCAKRHPPPRYRWVDPAYELVQASIVPCNADLLAALRGEKQAETTGEDNLKTVELIFASYESAARGEVVRLCGDAPKGGAELEG
ncbi:MAG: Gfo/Idh/MocA family oxidoreductase [Acidobacteria bacterium]|nr:Gfo/Idh/MocA family oxidoreductase [Acidobacteriota bacterium]MCW5969101.1 Gfo/Idh/MocA family oxidoreductase [Blastocatellales bacterium]